MILGCHVRMNAPDYVLGSVQEALDYGANALMLYTGAPQNTKRVPTEKLKIGEGLDLLKENGIAPERIIVHAPYLINPANSVKPEVAELAVEFLQSEIKRTAAIGGSYIVLHPGSYTTTDLETGIKTVIEQLNRITDIPEGIIICLETMAGKGSEVGSHPEELAQIIEGLHSPEHYGICLDTCHMNDAGYDISDFDGILDRIDSVLGLEKLKVIHLNDSKNPCGARKDRHENIGFGTIGFDNLYAVAMNKRTEGIAKILETPYVDGEPPYKQEIAMLRSGTFDPQALTKKAGS